MSKAKSPNELVERYLQAVRFWMPKTKRQEDLLAELGEDLRSQIEAKEAELGRTLTQEETSEILKRCGAPMVVAFQMGPSRYLIGPALFPVYWFVMKMVLFWILVPVFIFIVGPANVANAGGNWGTAVLATIGDLWSGMFIAAGVITLVFAILERTQAVAKATYKWDPLKLPPVPAQERKPSRMQTVCQLAFAVFGLVWVLLLPQYPWLILGPAAAFLKASPTMHVFYLPIVLLGVVAIVRPAITLARPQWGWLPPLAELVQGVLSLILLNFMLNMAGQTPGGEWHPFLVVTDAGINSAQYIKAAAIVNASVLISLAGAWLGLGIAVAIQTWQVLKVIGKRFSRAGSAASLLTQ